MQRKRRRAVDYIHLKYEERDEERRLANACNERRIRGSNYQEDIE
jgi:hypothetical protein